MLVDFRFSNFRSFKQDTHFSTLKMDDKDECASNRILPIVSIFGANASGKSNVFRALGWMRQFVLLCGRYNSTDRIPVDPFIYDGNSRFEPTSFEVRIFLDKKFYRYGFSVTDKTVVDEWLFRTADCHIEEKLIFRRKGREITGGIIFKRYARVLRENSLLLVRLDQDNNSTAKRIIQWMNQLVGLEGIDTDGLYPYSAHKFSLKDSKTHRRMLNFLRLADPTIVDTTTREEEAEKVGSFGQKSTITRTVLLRHTQEKDNVFVGTDFSTRESTGTRKMFMISGPVTDVLDRGGVLAIDELESGLHPLLIDYIIKLFASKENNPKAAQLIFTTHDVGLIDRLRLKPEQIVVCQKRLDGESFLYPISDFPKKDSRDKAFMTRFMSGEFGGVPILDESGWLYNRVHSRNPDVEER